LNGDGETDFYESFFADTDVSDQPIQAFNYGLQTDRKGNFIYAKGGQYTTDDEPGHIIRVTPDGKKKESLAIGFRAPNGVTVGPKDDIYSSDNQGNWMPANKISLIQQGKFYGYLMSTTRSGGPEYRMKAPLGVANYPDQVLPMSFEEPINGYLRSSISHSGIECFSPGCCNHTLSQLINRCSKIGYTRCNPEIIQRNVI